MKDVKDQVVIVHKADVSPSQPIGDCNICIIDPPVQCERGDTLEVVDRQFEADAIALEKALRDYLPGGTYDRLLGRMLAYKASHFVVSHNRKGAA